MIRSLWLPIISHKGRLSSLEVAMVILLSGAIGALIGLSPVISILLVAVTLFAVFFFSKTWNILLLVLLTRPIFDAEIFRAIDFLPLKATPGAALTLLVMVLGLLYIFMLRIRFDKQLVSLVFFIFIAMSMTSAIFSNIALSAGLYDWFRILSTWVFYVLLVSMMQSRERIKILVNVLIVSSFVPIAVGLHQLFSGTGVIAGGIHRVLGTFVWPNSFARFMLVPIILVVVLFLYAESNRRRMIYGGYLILAISVFLATYARGSWISLFAGLMIIGMVRKRKFFVVLSAIIIVVLLVPSPISERFDDLTSSTNTFLNRQIGWNIALKSYEDQPIFGLLFGAGWGYLDDVVPEVIGGSDVPVHNDYIRLLVETGAVGLLVYLVIIVALGYNTLHNLHSSNDEYLKALNLAFIGILTANILISATDASVIASPITQIYFWSFAAVVQATHMYELKPIHNSSEI